MTQTFSATTKPHAVCVPLPLQSHINAMLKFAKLLYSRGFNITFVNTEYNHNKLLQSRGPASLSGLPGFRFVALPDGLPPCDTNAAQDMVALVVSIKRNFKSPLCDLIVELNEASVLSGAPRVSCIVSDGAMSCHLEVAEEFGVPGVLLWTMSAAFLMICLHCRRLVEEGRIPLLGRDKSRLGEASIDSIPGVKDIRLKDLPTFFLDTVFPCSSILIGGMPTFYKASAIVMNTFDALEYGVLEAAKSMQLPPIYPMGPLQLLLQEVSGDELGSIGSNLWAENDECLKWLDSKEPNSVIYVNFGTHTVLSPQQLTELAWGFSNSGHSFLWIIRPGTVTGEAGTLTPEFTEKTGERGMIAGWCQQEKVLSHTSVGGFLTHSGWNSTMDTVCSGVPIISWPVFSDQHTNCRYACFHWGIGIEMDSNLERDEVERLVGELMTGEEGIDKKKKAMEWKMRAEESTKPGGSSYLNLDKLIDDVIIKN